jgi:hypothetical protein
MTDLNKCSAKIVKNIVTDKVYEMDLNSLKNIKVLYRYNIYCNYRIN